MRQDKSTGVCRCGWGLCDREGEEREKNVRTPRGSAVRPEVKTR